VRRADAFTGGIVDGHTTTRGGTRASGSSGHRRQPSRGESTRAGSRRLGRRWTTRSRVDSRARSHSVRDDPGKRAVLAEVLDAITRLSRRAPRDAGQLTETFVTTTAPHRPRGVLVAGADADAGHPSCCALRPRRNPEGHALGTQSRHDLPWDASPASSRKCRCGAVGLAFRPWPRC